MPEDEPLLAARRSAAELGGAEPVLPAVGAALRFLACAVGARTAVEIGTGCGSSGIWLLRGMRPGSTLTSVDTEPEYQRVARKAFTQAGFAQNQCRLILGRALDVLPRLSDGAYDMVFCDADARDYPDYLTAGLRLLRVGGIVAFNNALLAGPDGLAGRAMGKPQPTIRTALTPSTCRARSGQMTFSSPCCCRWAMACSPRSSGATKEPAGIGSANHRFQCVAKPSCFVGCELNNESAAAFKRDTHYDAAPLLGDLKRTVTRPRLHRRHSPIPFLRAHRARRTGSAHAAIAVSAVKPASHNRFYLSPYYPVFGSRMVMIGDPWRAESTRNGLFGERSAISPARRVDQPPVTPAARLNNCRAARRRRASSGPPGPPGPPGRPAAEAAIEGVHARVAQGGGRLRIGHVEGARPPVGYLTG